MCKTVKIDKLIDTSNVMLLNLPDEDVNARHAIINLLTSLLHDAGSYSGFRYLDADDMVSSASGRTVGINGKNGQHLEWEARFAGTDATRVHYF